VKSVKFQKKAQSDLAGIKRFYADISPQTLENVIADVTATLRIIREHPESGFIYKPNRRMMATTKYKYNITYSIKQDFIEIRGIYRYQNR